MTFRPPGRYPGPSTAGTLRSRANTRRTGTTDTGIYLVPTQGGEPRRLTQATAPADHRAPAFSHDRRRLAYASCNTVLACDVEVLDLDATLAPVGPPRRLAASIDLLSTLAWTRDGTSVIYDSEPAIGVFYLWRVGVDGTRPPERIEVAGLHAGMPATVLSRDRLAFLHNQCDQDIYRFERGRASQPVIVSSFADWRLSSPRTVAASPSIPPARARRWKSGWPPPTGRRRIN